MRRRPLSRNLSARTIDQLDELRFNSMSCDWRGTSPASTRQAGLYKASVSASRSLSLVRHVMSSPGANLARPSLRFQSELLVGRRARHVGNEPDGRLGDAGAVAGDVGQLEEWRVHHLFVDELLGLVQ